MNNQATSSQRTKNMVILAMLSAIAFVVMCVGRIPILLWLKYDPKDVIIAIGGFLFGPLSALLMSVVVSLVEMITVSDTGIIGAIMNVLSTCAFVCPAAYIYKKKHTLAGAVVGLISGVLLMTAVMILWNYLLTPLYMNQPREEVAALLVPVFLPFNLVKGGLNTALTILLYKPVITALRKGGMLPPSSSGKKGKFSIGVFLCAGLALITLILVVLVMRGIL